MDQLSIRIASIWYKNGKILFIRCRVKSWRCVWVKWRKLFGTVWSCLISPNYPKLLLYNRHTSHCTNEFKALAAKIEIILYQFPSHLTHIVQPLDVGCFQTWKHFHNLAIHESLQNLQNSYNSAAFLQDLAVIRMKTLTISTIVSAFKILVCSLLILKLFLKR